MIVLNIFHLVKMMTIEYLLYLDFKISRIARSGFVETWYDQSDNGRDMLQDAASEQPIIVENGGQVKDPSKALPSIKFQQPDGTGGRNCS